MTPLSVHVTCKHKTVFTLTIHKPIHKYIVLFAEHLVLYACSYTPCYIEQYYVHADLEGVCASIQNQLDARTEECDRLNINGNNVRFMLTAMQHY
jgi:hypothetical protein